jgi:UDP-2,3-diacylglucosamine hydrolase
MLKKKDFDFFVFGHRHLPIDFRLAPLSPGRGTGGEARYINLGDWIHYYTYAAFDGENLELKSYKNKDEKIIKYQ